MTRDEIRDRVLHALGDIAPEIDPTALVPGAPLRDQLDIDSMDFLNFVIAIHQTLGIDIPEADYPRFSTLDGGVDYLVGRLGHD